MNLVKEVGEGNGTPLQYACLGKSMDRGACGPQSMVSQELETTENTHTS